MELISRVIGPLATNVYLVGDGRTREAIAIDAAIPGLSWITGELQARGWRLALIVSTHGHWDHSAENAALQAWSREAPGAVPVGAPAREGAALAEHASEHGLAVVDGRGTSRQVGFRDGAKIAAHRDDWHRLTNPQPLYAPFPIPPCVPAVELAEGGAIRFGDVSLAVLHTPGHTEGSVCLLAEDHGLLFSGDTLFPGGWGRVDLPGGDPDAMVASLARLAALPDDRLRVLPGHGSHTTLGAERLWLQQVAREGRLPG